MGRIMVDWDKFRTSCRKRLRTVYNFFVDLRRPGPLMPTGLPALNRIREASRRRTALNDHLETLFLESLTLKPKLIVELGVARGESTQVFAQVAKLCGAKLLGVDIRDCSGALDWERWSFIQMDDLEFAGRFEAWCREQNLEPQIDVLFIDTSHYFDHTLAEIRAYFPFLSDHAKVFFHDTNLKPFFFRKDGSLDLGWDNARGVIRALEVFFGRSFPEHREFVDFVPPWLIRHYPYCCGLTILEKLAHIFPDSPAIPST